MTRPYIGFGAAEYATTMIINNMLVGVGKVLGFGL